MYDTGLAMIATTETKRIIDAVVVVVERGEGVGAGMAGAEVGEGGTSKVTRAHLSIWKSSLLTSSTMERDRYHVVIVVQCFRVVCLQ